MFKDLLWRRTGVQRCNFTIILCKIAHHQGNCYTDYNTYVTFNSMQRKEMHIEELRKDLQNAAGRKKA